MDKRIAVDPKFYKTVFIAQFYFLIYTVRNLGHKINLEFYRDIRLNISYLSELVFGMFCHLCSAVQSKRTYILINCVCGYILVTK